MTKSSMGPFDEMECPSLLTTAEVEFSVRVTKVYLQTFPYQS